MDTAPNPHSQPAAARQSIWYGLGQRGGTTGSYIYNDLRLADPFSGSQQPGNIASAPARCQIGQNRARARTGKSRTQRVG